MRRMIIYANADGIVKEYVNFGQVAQGNSNYDRVYVIYEGVYDAMTYMLNSGQEQNISNSGNIELVDDADASVPSGIEKVNVGELDLKELKLFKNYYASCFDFTSEDLSVDGVRKMTISARVNGVGSNDPTLVARFSVFFNVQNQVIQSPDTISQSQYDYLLGELGKQRVKYITLANDNPISQTEMGLLTGDKATYILYNNDKYYLMETQPLTHDWIYASDKGDSSRFVKVHTNISSAMNWEWYTVAQQRVTPFIELEVSKIITQEEMQTLLNDKSAYILFNREKYYLMDYTQDGSNMWVYAHTGDQTIKYVEIYTQVFDRVNWGSKIEDRLSWTYVGG